MRLRLAAALLALLLRADCAFDAPGVGSGGTHAAHWGALLRGTALDHVVQHWRVAEYAAQADERRALLLERTLASKADANAASPDKIAYDSPLPREQLAAELNATRAALAALRPELQRLRAAVDGVWGAPGETLNATATPHGADDTPLDHCSASRLRDGMRPHPTSPLPPNVFTRRYNVSFVLQYYKHPANIDVIVDTLYACTRGSAPGGPVAAGIPPGTTSELIVNADSRGDEAAWGAAVARTANGSFATVLLSNNLHEIHGYNRAAAVARGDIVVFLQDDTLPPSECHWMADLLARFNAFPKLAAVGMNVAEFWFPTTAHYVDGHNMQHRMSPHSILYRHKGVPFQFVAVADYGPYAVRASAFAAVGGLDEAMGQPGDCGIVTDYELSLRFWTAGWQVGHMRMRDGMRSGTGVGGTHANERVQLQCWRRQITLNADFLTRRYSLDDGRAVFRQVQALNGRLEAAFEGPPLWEKCCGREGECELCGTANVSIFTEKSTSSK